MPRGNCPLRLAIFLLAVSAQAAEYDPYRVLGVGRSASQAEVKRAYKTLAKEWHPDKNKDPKAEDMFIKVSKSYEVGGAPAHHVTARSYYILSNEERRSNFDRFGQLEENQPLGPSQQGSRGFHNSFYFDESFFHFPRSRDFADSKYLLQHAAFNSDVLPDSHRRPYLLKVTSEWCFACIHIEPVWKETVLQLEPLGKSGATKSSPQTPGMVLTRFDVHKYWRPPLGPSHQRTRQKSSDPGTGGERSEDSP
ncbi:DnaJ subfamily C member 16 [Liparis tanakae]|uniref:DnaJ subfamily C member 16 n=1 Tax=Liparis tanakae TaxID=230148 RepID=A0A4Z2F2B1_9TELE|nr:DnaJ subfamily C member 16 [Liparis tanakae]